MGLKTHSAITPMELGIKILGLPEGKDKTVRELAISRLGIPEEIIDILFS